MRSARHIAIRVLVFALLGAATTVAVAWGIAIGGIDVYGRSWRADQTPVAIPDVNNSQVFVSWPRVSGRGWTWTTTVLMPIKWISPDGMLIEPDGYVDKDHGAWVIDRTDTIPSDRQLPFEDRPKHVELRVGWPVVCMWAIGRGNGLIDFVNSYGWSPVKYLRQDQNTRTQPFIRGQSPAPDIALPLGILPRGFAINTAFYAGAWWVLLIGLARGRAWNRQRRGLCVKCTYDLRGLEPRTPCPECGRIRTSS